MSAPRRAVVLTAEIQADTRHDLASALFNLANQIEAGEVCGPAVVCGGCRNSSYILNLSESDEPTHDQYVDQLRTFLKNKKGESKD